jgi:hypothetical protein
MRCGNRHGILGDHEHATAAEVRACYGFGAQAESPTETVLSREQVFGEEAPAINLASPKQINYINDLRVERGMDPLPANTQMARSIASAKIAELLLVHPIVKEPAGVAYANVTEGHYAIPGRDGRDYDFYRVDKPTEGKWAGRTFLKMVVGGKPDISIRDRNRISEVLAAIALNPEEAAWRYGQEIGQCDKCNRSLTDETSRAFSRGPDCRQKYGAGFMSMASQRRRSRPAGAPTPSRPRSRAS